MPVFIGIVLLIGMYGGLCWLAIAYLVAPSLPYVVLVSGICGVVLGVGILVLTLLRIPGLAAADVTPADVRDRLPRPRSNFERDRAWPLYLFAQSRTDLAAARDRTTRLLSRMWAILTRPVTDEPNLLIAWPLLAIPLAAALSLTAAAVVGGAVAYLLAGVVLAVAWLGWLVAVGVLRGVDRGIRTLRRARVSCHNDNCNHRSWLPAYRCTCGEIHHDIRAGRLGVFARRCQCGRLLPTTVLGATGLVVLCQKCDKPLRTGAGLLTDIVLPVFGPTSAGKTRLVFAAMVALERHLKARGGSLKPVGPDSEATFQQASSVIGRREQTTKTAVGAARSGITVRLSLARRRALLHLYDAAGELFAEREQTRELPYLDDTEGFVFVVDPFSIPAVAGALRGSLEPLLIAANAATMDPEQSYTITTQTLGDQGVELDKLPLAVVLVKADLLTGLPPAEGLGPEPTSTEIASWLRDNGLDNMVTATERDFAAVRYFLVSSLDEAIAVDGSAGVTSAAQPLLWLLGRSGMPAGALGQRSAA